MWTSLNPLASTMTNSFKIMRIIWQAETSMEEGPRISSSIVTPLGANEHSTAGDKAGQRDAGMGDSEDDEQWSGATKLAV